MRQRRRSRSCRVRAAGSRLPPRCTGEARRGSGWLRRSRSGSAEQRDTHTSREASLHFGADDGINGIEPWKSDGAAAGTILLRHINDNGDSLADHFTVSGGTLYFSAFDQTNGNELWKSDGTQSGTMLVEDIRPGPFSSSVQGLVDVGGTLFFAANDGVNGRELWSSDGTLAGTTLVKDINPGAGNSIFNAFEDSITEFGGEAYFGADDGSGIGLWKSDGTFGGTTQVVSGLIPKSFTEVGGTLYIVRANLSTGSMFAPNLWKSDGTAGWAGRGRPTSGQRPLHHRAHRFPRPR